MLSNDCLFGNGQNAYAQGQANCGYGYGGGYSGGLINSLGLNNQYDLGFNQLSQFTGGVFGQSLWNSNFANCGQQQQPQQQIQCNLPSQQFIQQPNQCQIQQQLPQFVQTQPQPISVSFNAECQQPIQQQISFGQLAQQIPCNIQQQQIQQPVGQFIQTQPIIQQIPQQIQCQQQLIPQQVQFSVQQSVPQFVSQPIQCQQPIACNVQPQMSQIISQPLIQQGVCNYQQQPVGQLISQPIQQQSIVQCQQSYPVQLAPAPQPVCASPQPTQQIINHTQQDSIFCVAPNQTPLNQTNVFYRQSPQQVDACLQSGVYTRPQC